MEMADDGERRGLEDAVGGVGRSRSHHGLLRNADRGLERPRGRDRHGRHGGDDDGLDGLCGGKSDAEQNKVND